MPKGRRGEKRPARLVGNAVKVIAVATGEEAEELADSINPPPPRQVACGANDTGAAPRNCWDRRGQTVEALNPA